jgi:hypothetical protein
MRTPEEFVQATALCSIPDKADCPKCQRWIAAITADRAQAREAGIEECATDLLSLVQKKSDGRTCNCERCDELMTAARRLRSLIGHPVKP